MQIAKKTEKETSNSPITSHTFRGMTAPSDIGNSPSVAADTAKKNFASSKFLLLTLFNSSETHSSTAISNFRSRLVFADSTFVSEDMCGTCLPYNNSHSLDNELAQPSLPFAELQISLRASLVSFLPFFPPFICHAANSLSAALIKPSMPGLSRASAASATARRASTPS